VKKSRQNSKVEQNDEWNMPKFIISVAARMLDLHPQTLRQYEKRGFVEPYRLGNLRLYSENDLEVLNEIKELANEGIPTCGIERILKLRKQSKEQQARIQFLERENSLLRERLRKEVPPLPVKIEYKSFEFRFFKANDEE